MTPGWDSLAIGEFEHLAVGPSVVLLRVNGRSSRARPSPGWRPALIADDGSGPQRFAALPSPPDADGVLRAAYSVPVTLLAGETRFFLELTDGQRCELGSPARGTPRRPADPGRTTRGETESDERAASEPTDPDPDVSAGGQTDEGSDDGATLSAALTEARERAAELEAENQKLSSTLEELEIWREELERRLADTTTELAETKVRLTAAHAAAEMEALVARAEADALEQAARELTEAAEGARSRA